MKAGVLHAKNDMRYEEYPMPELKYGEVLIKIMACGICGSDLPRVLGDGAHFYPVVLGHEFSGLVEAVGEGVTKIKVGDKVAPAPLLPCHKCEDCAKGNHSQCKNYSFIGSRQQGAFAQYVTVPERNTVKFDDSISFEQGALFEPSTVGLHGLYCADFQGGEDVAVLGGGTIGMFTAQWARRLGAKRVFVFDIDDDRLDLMKKLGVDEVINTSEEDFMQKAMGATNGKGFGYVFETAGLNITMSMAFELAANKANVCFIGTSHRDLSFDAKLFEKMNRKEFTLTGSWMSYSAPYPGKEWEMTSQCFADGRLKYVDEMIFKKMPMSKIADAFSMYETPGMVKGKILLIND
jgi:L-iditol 2-dehydrogenase